MLVTWLAATPSSQRLACRGRRRLAERMRLTRHSVARSTIAASVAVGKSVSPGHASTPAATDGAMALAQAKAATASVVHSPPTVLARPARRVQEYLQEPMTQSSVPADLPPQTPHAAGFPPARGASILSRALWGVVQWQDIRFWS